MKILVTGHRGFIGSNLYSNLKLAHTVDGYEWGDAKFPGYNYDVIMHLGAISTTTESDIEKIMIQNYDFSVELIENCNDRGIKFQFASSASIYGLGTDFSESARPDPRTPYAWSKYLVERYVAKKQWNIPVQIFRYFNVYGPGEEHKQQPSPYYTFAKQYQNQGYIELFQGSENYFRDFVPVDKVIDVHKRFLNINQSGIWNVGTGFARSFLDVANSITDKHRFIPMPQNLLNSYQKYTCADITKLHETLSSS